MSSYETKISFVEVILIILEGYDNGEINLMEAVHQFQQAGSVMDPNDIVEMLLEFDRNNVVRFPVKVE